MNLQNIRGLRGADNMPGTAVEVLFAPKEWFQTIQTPAADDVVITQSHVFKPGRAFISIYNSLKSGEFKSDMKGGIDGRYQEQMYEGFIPGIRPEVMRIARIVQNVEGIFIVRENNGKVLQIGSAEYPAYLSFSSTTGKVGGDDVAGYQMKAESFGIGTLFYTGALPVLADGAIANGVGSVVMPLIGLNIGKVFKATLSQGNAAITIGSFVPQSGDTEADLAQGLADAIVAAGIAGVTGATASANTLNVNVVGTTFNGWNLNVLATNSAFTGEALFTIGDSGAEGDTLQVSLSFGGFVFPLGSVTRPAGTLSASGLAALAAAACEPNPFNLTVSADSASVKFAVADANDPNLDGAFLVVTPTGGITDVSTLAQRTF